MMNAMLRALVLLPFIVENGYSFAQSFVYTEPGNASCPATSAPSVPVRKTLKRDVPLSGSISVDCGFDKGSYTVTLNATDPDATFSPRTFLVNFGKVVGDGRFHVTFSSVGVQSVSATITSNMGSPPVPGRFASDASEFDVVNP
jgi:hypothetical protein